jgi:hypothetical protein
MEQDIEMADWQKTEVDSVQLNFQGVGEWCSLSRIPRVRDLHLSGLLDWKMVRRLVDACQPLRLSIRDSSIPLEITRPVLSVVFLQFRPVTPIQEYSKELAKHVVAWLPNVQSMDFGYVGPLLGVSPFALKWTNLTQIEWLSILNRNGSERIDELGHLCDVNSSTLTTLKVMAPCFSDVLRIFSMPSLTSLDITQTYETTPLQPDLARILALSRSLTSIHYANYCAETVDQISGLLTGIDENKESQLSTLVVTHSYRRQPVELSPNNEACLIRILSRRPLVMQYLELPDFKINLGNCGILLSLALKTTTPLSLGFMTDNREMAAHLMRDYPQFRFFHSDDSLSQLWVRRMVRLARNWTGASLVIACIRSNKSIGASVVALLPYIFAMFDVYECCKRHYCRESEEPKLINMGGFLGSKFVRNCCINNNRKRVHE